MYNRLYSEFRLIQPHVVYRRASKNQKLATNYLQHLDLLNMFPHLIEVQSLCLQISWRFSNRCSSVLTG